MDRKHDKKAAPVKPYDESIWDQWSMYDNMPYVWDPDLNAEMKFAKVSGNIIKSNRCMMKEPFELKHEG